MKNIFLKTLFILNLAASTNVEAQLVINEYQADPSGTDGDANGDGEVNTAEDEFVEIYNTSASQIDITGWTLSDGNRERHTFPSGSIVPGNCSIVIFSGGTPSGAFGFSTVQTASSGALGLNNSGDTIELKSGNSVAINFQYTGSSNINQSITRDPVGTGLFTKHSEATGSNSALFSPGTNIDGSNFSGCPTGDLPPTVKTTAPANQESGVAISSNITITFSENVNIASGATTLNCGATDLSYTGDNVMDTDMLVINPDADLPDGSICSVTLNAATITDTDEGLAQLDGNKDTTAGDNFSFSFITGSLEKEIWEIQGDGTATTFDGLTIKTSNNIVTALDTNGIYIQTPDARADTAMPDNDAIPGNGLNDNTSNGIFIYTGANPVGTYKVGDQVDVEGKVIEFFGTTEFTTPVTIMINSSGNTLPTPVILNDDFPPNDPTKAVCSTDQETHKYECLEGMAFSMPQGFISAGFAGNPVFPGRQGEDIIVRAGKSRAFREPGIDHPGDSNLSTLTYDTNPEILQVDLDGLGILDVNTLDYAQYAGGTEFSAKGVFVFDFDVYKIAPSELTVIKANTIPDTVRNATATEVTIGSSNLFRLFDAVDDPHPDDDESVPAQDYQNKVTKLAKYIHNNLKSPMILAVQEAENIGVLNALTAQIKIESGNTVNYTAHLIEANDPGGIDVGYLLRDNVAPADGFPKQLGASEIQSTTGSQLHDRRPLHLQATVTLASGTIQVQVLAVHNRSRGSIEDSNATEAARVRNKRFEQANSIAAMIKNIQDNNPDDPIITLGDFNAFQFSDGYADVIGQITGTAKDEENEYWSQPLFANKPLTQAVQILPTTEQYSFVFNGVAQLLDNAIINDQALMRMNKIEFARGQSDANISFASNASSPLRVSDHDGFVIFLTKDIDVIYKNGFEAQ